VAVVGVGSVMVMAQRYGRRLRRSIRLTPGFTLRTAVLLDRKVDFRRHLCLPWDAHAVWGAGFKGQM
jgi:hypothetical protein